MAQKTPLILVALTMDPGPGLRVEDREANTLCRDRGRAKMTLKFLGAGAALALGCVAMTIASARADVAYTYTGNAFTTVTNINPPPAPQYTTTDSVSGNFTLPTAIGDNLPLATI